MRRASSLSVHLVVVCCALYGMFRLYDDFIALRTTAPGAITTNIHKSCPSKFSGEVIVLNLPHAFSLPLFQRVVKLSQSQVEACTLYIPKQKSSRILLCVKEYNEPHPHAFLLPSQVRIVTVPYTPMPPRDRKHIPMLAAK